MKQATPSAFTLMEIVIIIVVTGLIVGGIVAARNMLESAEMRNTLSQLQDYNTGVNSFMGKYGEMPGDFRRGANFGMGASGNGDKFLKDSDPATLGWHDKLDGEIANAWLHLSASGLIDEEFSMSAVPLKEVDFPVVSGDTETGIIIFTDSLTRAFYIGVGDSIGDKSIHYEAGLRPYQAYYLDEKMDDGLPLTGRVTSRMLLAGETALDDGTFGDGIDTCTHPDDVSLYNIDARPISCMIRYDME